MVSMNSDPEAGGNVAQPDDGRDENGRLPEPLDAAYYGDPDGPAIVIPGMPLSQPAGTGPVVSATAPEEQNFDDVDGVEHRDDSAAAQGGPDVAHDISGSVVGGAAPAPSGPGLRTDNTPTATSGTLRAQPAKKTAAPAKKTADTPPSGDQTK